MVNGCKWVSFLAVKPWWFLLSRSLSLSVCFFYFVATIVSEIVHLLIASSLYFKWLFSPSIALFRTGTVRYHHITDKWQHWSACALLLICHILGAFWCAVYADLYGKNQMRSESKNRRNNACQNKCNCVERKNLRICVYLPEMWKNNTNNINVWFGKCFAVLIAENKTKFQKKKRKKTKSQRNNQPRIYWLSTLVFVVFSRSRLTISRARDKDQVWEKQCKTLSMHTNIPLYLRTQTGISLGSSSSVSSIRSTLHKVLNGRMIFEKPLMWAKVWCHC